MGLIRRRKRGRGWGNRGPRRFPGPQWLISALFALISCSPESGRVTAPAGDIRPPCIVSAGQKGSGAFEICFNEEVAVVPGSFSFQPGPTAAEASAAGSAIEVSLSPAAKPGENCSLSGEAQDLSGNITRFLFTFAGYNDAPAILRINELQCGKNSSASNPHRDYIEFVVRRGGNLGAEVVRWASSVKIMEYKFPSAEVKGGDIILLHCAPEGLPEEKDEVGQDLGISGGADSSSVARDFWTSAGGLPDATGIVALFLRETEQPYDGICYASMDRSGNIDGDEPKCLAKDLMRGGVWPFTDPPKWEEAFLWKNSSARPIHRTHQEQVGAGQWVVGESGTQSPGYLEPTVKTPKAAGSRGGKSRKKT